MEESTNPLIEKAQRLLERIPGVGFHGFLGQHLVYWHQDEHDEVQTYSVPFSDLPNFVAQCEKAAA